MTHQLKRAKKKITDELIDTAKVEMPFVRRIAARSATARKLILEVIAPDLLDLRLRHDALEEAFLSYVLIHDASDPDAPAFNPRLVELKGQARENLHEKYKLQHLAGPDQKLVWKGIEDKMIASLRENKRRELENAESFTEKKE